MTVGEHEPIAVGPDRVLRIEAHDAVPDRVDQRRQRHRRAGVPGLGLLDRIDRQGADGVDRQLIQLLVGHVSPSRLLWAAHRVVAGRFVFTTLLLLTKHDRQ